MVLLIFALAMPACYHSTICPSHHSHGIYKVITCSDTEGSNGHD